MFLMQVRAIYNEAIKYVIEWADLSCGGKSSDEPIAYTPWEVDTDHPEGGESIESPTFTCPLECSAVGESKGIWMDLHPHLKSFGFCLISHFSTWRTNLLCLNVRWFWSTLETRWKVCSLVFPGNYLRLTPTFCLMVAGTTVLKVNHPGYQADECTRIHRFKAEVDAVAEFYLSGL